MADITFECPECKQHLVIDAEESGAEIKCPTCSRSITVPSTPPAELPGSTPPSIKNEHFANIYILQANEKKGPYTIGQLRSLWNAGLITAQTLYSPEGFPEWIPLARIISDLEPSQPSSFGNKPPIIPVVGRFKITKKHIIMVASLTVLAFLCIIFFRQQILHGNSNSSSQDEATNARQRYTPGEFINKFGGYIKDDVKNILGPPDSVSGGDWCYHNIIYNPDTEKLDDVWIEFGQKPDYPIVVIQVI